ncbi:hypothetical protein LDENG_00008670 [Lucifuga dentata]|nr:hypothetical protein LDENG_00008670 [Lucifuga dentata]
MLEGDFAICISLYHGYELLMQMGLRSLFFYVQGIMDGSREMSRARNELQRTPIFMDLYHEMEAMFVKASAGPDESFIYSHPKLKKLEEVVLQHFRGWAESLAENNASASTVSRPQEVSTRVMIFSSFRESVQEIAAMLDRRAPLIRVMTFMGQASAGKGVKGFTQKEQLEVVHRFRQGGFNTLVSTCVGEEGLDIGEVDLIVCFDAQKNPIRLVQRMGRTGRKRQGRIVVILAEGREERIYNQSQSNRRNVYKSIIGSKNGFHMYPNSPRMLPEGVNPSLHKMHITCGQFDPRESSRRSVRGRRSHSEGRVSIIHPQNLMRQGNVKSDGFLDSTEYSLWASTMRLQDNEVHPTLRRSRFMSLPSDLPPQEEVSKSGPPSRELSLWEWRHWQNKALPTHRVDHSLHCQHFIKVMELIDHMREENQGDCAYEQELLPYLHKADAVGQLKNGRLDKTMNRKRFKHSSTFKPSISSSCDLESISEDGQREITRGTGIVFPLAMTKRVEHETGALFDDIRNHAGPYAFCPPPSNNDCPVADMDDDCVIVDDNSVSETEQTVSDPLNLDNISELITKFDKSKPSQDEDAELDAMFYLPKWDSPPSSAAKLFPRKQRDESFRIIVANVAELLSRSPPPLTLDLDGSLYEPVPADTAVLSPPPSPKPMEESRGPHQHFQVSFTLDVDDDELMSNADNSSPRADSNEIPMNKEDTEVYNDLAHQQPHQLLPPDSPSALESLANQVFDEWDEVFNDDVINDNNGIWDEMDDEIDNSSKEEQVGEEMQDLMDGGVKEDRNSHLLHPPPPPQPAAQQLCRPWMDESMDLFGDDEAFLHLTIPEIPTLEDCVTPNTSSKDILNITLHTHRPVDTCSTVHSTGITDILNAVWPRDSAHGSNTNHISHTVHTNQATNPHNNAHYSEPKHENTPETDRDETNTDNLLADKAITSHCKSPTMQRNPECSDDSHDYFSINFDLGYSLEDSEEEAELETVPAPCMSICPRPEKQHVPSMSSPALFHSSTLYHSSHRQRPAEFKSSTPQTLSAGKRDITSPLTSPLLAKGQILTSPITSSRSRRMLVSSPSGPQTPCSLLSLKRRRQEGRSTDADRAATARQRLLGEEHSDPRQDSGNSDSEDGVVHKRRHRNKANPFYSPEEVCRGSCGKTSIDNRPLTESYFLQSKTSIDVDSLLLVNRKHAAALNISDETEGEAVSDDDFQSDAMFIRRSTAHEPERQRVRQGKTKHVKCQTGRQFLNEEAELSEEEGTEVSSDEEDGDDQNQSLEGFVVDNTHLSQELNASEMQGVYLKSVRSPAVAGKFKMSYKNHHNMNIFSQVPEMDETYAEDSFVVGSDVEELESSEEEVEDVVELIPEVSYVDGRKQYATRRCVFLHKIGEEAGAGGKTWAQSPPEQRAGVKTKRSRIIHVEDSSEEETEEVGKEKSLMTGGDVVSFHPKVIQQDTKSTKPQQPQNAPSCSSTIASKVSLLSREKRSSASEEQQKERCRQSIEIQHLVSDELDFVESESLLSSRKSPQAPPSTSALLQPQKAPRQDSSVGKSPAPCGPLCILVDSRCISTGLELLTSLRQRHNATVHVCSLDGSYFIISNRMAVERHSQSDLAAMQNRKRLAGRVASLQELFERVCLIVEKDRTKPGEASRPFQRTRYYDSTMAALVHTGVRLLWSDGPEESATLLADLAWLEQRKGQGIAVPLEVKGQHRQQALQLFLSLPSVSYVHALNMSHNFSSIAQLINSPIEAIQKGGCMSRPRAEEIYRFLRYSCDSFLMNTSAGKNS